MTENKAPKPEVVLKNFVLAAPFFYAAKDGVGRPACTLLALASNFRLWGANLYRLFSNENLEKMLGLSHGQLMRAKRQLRDKGLLDYDGNPGDYTHLKKRWEERTGYEWEGDL